MANQLEIRSITERTDINENGQVIKVYEVSFTSKMGARGTMRFPVADYEPIEARKQVELKAASLDALFG